MGDIGINQLDCATQHTHSHFTLARHGISWYVDQVDVVWRLTHSQIQIACLNYLNSIGVKVLNGQCTSTSTIYDQMYDVGGAKTEPSHTVDPLGWITTLLINVVQLTLAQEWDWHWNDTAVARKSKWKFAPTVGNAFERQDFFLRQLNCDSFVRSPRCRLMLSILEKVSQGNNPCQ